MLLNVKYLCTNKTEPLKKKKKIVKKYCNQPKFSMVSFQCPNTIPQSLNPKFPPLVRVEQNISRTVRGRARKFCCNGNNRHFKMYKNQNFLCKLTYQT